MTKEKIVGESAARRGKKDNVGQGVIGAINHWCSLPVEERRRHHLEVIPRHVANSMAMEGEPVDEEWLRERLVRRIRQRAIAISKPPSAS